MTLDEANRAGRLREGDLIAMMSIGRGAGPGERNILARTRVEEHRLRRHPGSQRIKPLGFTEESGRQRDALLFMPAIHEFRFHPGHINIGRTLAFAGFAAQAQLQPLFDLGR
jgi:hypothetical protein